VEGRWFYAEIIWTGMDISFVAMDSLDWNNENITNLYKTGGSK